MAVKRGLTLQNISDAKILRFDFKNEWFEAFGKPQRTNVWFVYGNTGHGKTSFILQLMKCLASFSKFLFVSYEEGEISAALQDGIKRLGMLEVNKKVLVVTDTIEELEIRLNKKKSHDIILIDSLEYTDFRTIRQIRSFVLKYPKKLFIFIGQADGNKPMGKLGHDVLHYANQKIWVEGFRAICKGRSFGTKGYYTIWEERAREYWRFEETGTKKT